MRTRDPHHLHRQVSGAHRRPCHKRGGARRVHGRRQDHPPYDELTVTTLRAMAISTADWRLDYPRTLRYPDAVTAARKILVIEDERDILDLVRHYLEKEGFRTRTVADGAGGLAAARQERPDLIVLDLMLPGIDGLELCKKLRADPATAITPVIMLTAKADETDRIVGLELGADDYLTKPFSPKELVARVKALLRRGEDPAAPPPPSSFRRPPFKHAPPPARARANESP